MLRSILIVAVASVLFLAPLHGQEAGTPPNNNHPSDAHDDLRPGESRAPKKLWKYYEKEERLRELEEAAALRRANQDIKFAADAVWVQGSLLLPKTALDGRLSDDLQGHDRGKACSSFTAGNVLLTAKQIRDTVPHLRFHNVKVRKGDLLANSEDTAQLSAQVSANAPISTEEILAVLPRVHFVGGNTRLGDSVLYASMVWSTPAVADGKPVLNEQQLTLRSRLEEPVPAYSAMTEAQLKTALQALRNRTDLVNAFNALRIQLRLARLHGAIAYAEKVEPQFPKKLMLWEPVYFQFYDPNYIPGYFRDGTGEREEDGSVNQIVRMTMIGPGKFRFEEWNSYQVSRSRDFSLGPTLEPEHRVAMISSITITEFVEGGRLRMFYYPQVIGRDTRLIEARDPRTFVTSDLASTLTPYVPQGAREP